MARWGIHIPGLVPDSRCYSAEYRVYNRYIYWWSYTNTVRRGSAVAAEGNQTENVRHAGYV